MASDMMLYWGSGSPPCWRVMIALEEKGLQGYQSKLLSFDKKEHKSEEVLKLNPRGQMPTFKHGNTVINESMAICWYLENMFKSQGTSLFPSDNAENAEKAAILQSTFELMNLAKRGEDFFIYLFRTKKEDQKEDVIAEKKKAFREEMDIWEGYIKQTGSFIAGKNFSMADVFLFPQLGVLVRFGAKLKTRWPCIDAYYNRLCERPSVKASWPPHWKDGPGNNMLADL